MVKKLFVMLLAALFVFSNQWAGAAEEKKELKRSDINSELEDLKHRVEDLEKRVKSTEVVDELGHKFHPIHSIYGLKIGGGLTVTAQGVMHSKANNQRGAGAISADIALESPVGKDGRAVAVLDFRRGPGLQNLPSFFTSPNGNTSGTNADIESFDNDQIHVTQFYYEHNIAAGLTASIGQLDITGYFDANEFANNERDQFLANLFVNNPTIEFGGSADFYSPGIRLTYGPVEAMDITVGAFEGNGDYNDMFNKPFLMAENKGVGLSIDQAIIDTIGVWLRGGIQREKVAQFDRFVGGGLNITGESFGRPNDAIGIGYGITLMGKDYKDYKKSSSNFESGPEHYMELYYNIAVADAAQNTGFHI